MPKQDSTYNIKIKDFEGPFDLLLFFIQRDELDINDIPITKITDDFLDYIHQREKLNIDVASEFILMAATLIRIKTKMLIPRKELDEFGEVIDPREELVNKLLEYKKVKSLLGEFRDFEVSRSEKYRRGNLEDELKKIAETSMVDVEMESFSLYKLMTVFNNLLDKNKQQKNKTVHTVKFYKYQVKEQKEYVLNFVSKGKRVAFEDLFEKMENRIHAIVTFLALLELLTIGQVSIVLGEGINNFWVEKR